MSKSHISHEEFFTRLSELLSSRHGKDHGSIHLTQKRLSNDTTSSTSATVKKTDFDIFSDLHPESPLPIIVRATNGKGKRTREKKVKLSTIVQPDDIDGFFSKYADICKSGMQALKKRDRKGRKTNKSKKKKGGADGEVKT